MYRFGTRSIGNLNELHEDLQVIMDELIKVYDFSIIEGHRSLETQKKYYREGKSTLNGVTRKSKHQSYPSLAADIMPYKKGTNAFSGNELDSRRFYMMMGMLKVIAIRLKAKGKITHDIRLGMDWDGDETFTDQNFHDLPHVELVI